MPVNAELSQKQFEGYSYCRDRGHLDFVAKADKCDRFTFGDQWLQADLNELGIQRRHHVVLAFKAALQLYERRQRALHLLGLQVIQNFVGRQDARLEQEANEAGIQYTAYEFRRVRR